MRTLYKIDADILSVLENGFAVDEETGEVLDGAEQVELLQMERMDKLENIALYLKSEAALIGNIDSEIAALKKRKEQHESRSNRIKAYLSASMEAAGEDKFETAAVAVSFRKSEAVVVTDQDGLDDKFFTETVTRKPSLTAIKSAIKAGETVAGAFIDKRRSVQIK